MYFIDCEDCIHSELSYNEYPCNNCMHNQLMKDHFEEKRSEEADEDKAR